MQRGEVQWSLADENWQEGKEARQHEGMSSKEERLILAHRHSFQSWLAFLISIVSGGLL